LKTAPVEEEEALLPVLHPSRDLHWTLALVQHSLGGPGLQTFPAPLKQSNSVRFVKIIEVLRVEEQGAASWVHIFKKEKEKRKKKKKKKKKRNKNTQAKPANNPHAPQSCIGAVGRMSTKE
jgi:hypothetical protein